MIADKGISRAVRLRLLVAGCVALLGVGCASPGPVPLVSDIPPLTQETASLDAPAALALAPRADLLALNAEMREFVDRYVRKGSQMQRLNTLHTSLRSPAFANVEYDASVDLPAREAWALGRANCLSYAHLFIALARYAGLDARYLSFTLRPRWTRHGEQVAIQQHVNVLVKLNSGQQFVVDIDPVSRDRIASAEVLSDEEAFALYHGNLAMEALLGNDYRRAYAQSVRALRLSPQTHYLWTNLGAIFRRAGNLAAAETSYRAALALDPGARSAMNNLAVLYHAQGRLEEAAMWAARVEDHREKNPYYHSYLGEEAAAAGDLTAAIGHYRDAIDLKAADAEFYYRLARLYHAQQDRSQSLKYVREAIERARLVGELEEYENFLAELTRATVASVES